MTVENSVAHRQKHRRDLVLRWKAIVAQNVDDLEWAFLLDAASTLAVISETISDARLVEFVGFLGLMFTILQVKREEGERLGISEEVVQS
jgi:hypothetical protein